MHKKLAKSHIVTKSLKYQLQRERKKIELPDRSYSILDIQD